MHFGARTKQRFVCLPNLLNQIHLVFKIARAAADESLEMIRQLEMLAFGREKDNFVRHLHCVR
jgi:hypothetical protein